MPRQVYSFSAIAIFDYLTKFMFHSPFGCILKCKRKLKSRFWMDFFQGRDSR